LDEEKAVQAEGFVSHKYSDYRSLLTDNQKFKIFNASTAPIYADSNNVFKYVETALVTGLLSYAGFSSSSSGYVSTVSAYLNEDKTAMTVDMAMISGLGNFKYVISDVGSAELAEITIYVTDNKGASPASDDASTHLGDVFTAIQTNTYSVALGTYTYKSVTKDAGKIIYTPNYYYYEYSTDNMNDYNTANSLAGDKALVRNGVFVKNGDIRKFTVTGSGDNETVTASSTIETSSQTLQEYGKYFSQSDVINKVAGHDMLLATYNQTYGKVYLSYDTTLAADFRDCSTNYDHWYTGYGVGIGSITVDENNALTGASVFFIFTYSFSTYMVKSALSEFNTASSTLVSDFIDGYAA
jgi:hypothetical protein